MASDDADDLEGGVDALYGLDPDEFTPARDRLAKERSAAGDKQGAAEIKKLRKPTVTAWAVNQVARRHPDDVDALLSAGADLRQAQQDAVAGGSAAALRDATRREQQAVGRAADLAAGVLRDAGREPNATHVERMAGTLRAAVAGGEAADLLRKGRLSTDLSSAGFGLDALLEAGPLPARPARPPAKKAAPARLKRDAGDDGRAEQERVEREQAEQERAERERLAALSRAAEEAAAQAAEAERVAEEAERRAAEAEQAAVAARHEAREAARAASHARKEARDAEARRRRAAESTGTA